MKIIPMHVDRAVNKKFFENETKLHVTSVFRTIQGEGPYAGYPAVFVRLAGCNFGDKSQEGHCPFCDSAFEIDKARKLHYVELLNEVVNLPGYNPLDVLVVTGGEPTLQPLLLDLLVAARHYFKAIQLESNGTQPYFFAELQKRNMTFVDMVVSPKANGKTGLYAPLSPTVIAYKKLVLKYVLSADPKSNHHTVPAFTKEVERQLNVYVSPMAVYLRSYDGEISNAWDHTLIDAKATSANYAYAAQYAMDNGFKLSIQTHLFTSIP